MKHSISIAGLFTLIGANAALATVAAPPPNAVPALDGWGLAGIAAALAVAGLLTAAKVRKR
ncbi:MAG: hypothetical protein KDG50_12165 [Chromatiales bacterium]|nr:hypothetical protein [Chromatiales bacterium]